MKRSALGLGAILLSLSACVGAGGGGAAAAARFKGLVTARTAEVALSITIPRRASTSSRGPASTRKPRYVSPGTESFSLYDGAMLIYTGNLTTDTPPALVTAYTAPGATTVTGGTCGGDVTITCGATVVTTVGSHTFGVYDALQAAPNPASTTAPSILSEGATKVTLSPGGNPAAAITLFGVAPIGLIGSRAE
jgi:hypothetical protein